MAAPWMAAPMANAQVGINFAAGLRAERLHQATPDKRRPRCATDTSRDLIHLRGWSGLPIRARYGSPPLVSSMNRRDLVSSYSSRPQPREIEVDQGWPLCSARYSSAMRAVRVVRKLLLGIFRAAQNRAPSPGRPVGDINAVLEFEVLKHVLDDLVVEIVAAEMIVAVAFETDFHDPLLNPHDRDVEGAAAEIVDQDLLTLDVAPPHRPAPQRVGSLMMRATSRPAISPASP